MIVPDLAARCSRPLLSSLLHRWSQNFQTSFFEFTGNFWNIRQFNSGNYFSFKIFKLQFNAQKITWKFGPKHRFWSQLIQGPSRWKIREKTCKIFRTGPTLAPGISPARVYAARRESRVRRDTRRAATPTQTQLQPLKAEKWGYVESRLLVLLLKHCVESFRPLQQGYHVESRPRRWWWMCVCLGGRAFLSCCLLSLVMVWRHFDVACTSNSYSFMAINY